VRLSLVSVINVNSYEVAPDEQVTREVTAPARSAAWNSAVMRAGLWKRLGQTFTDLKGNWKTVWSVDGTISSDSTSR